MNIKTWLSLFICWQLAGTQAFGQLLMDIDEIQFEKVSTDRLELGRSYLSVDQDGKLWVSARNGLFVYDGHGWDKFSPEEYGSKGKVLTGCNLVEEDTKGNIWAFYEMAGVVRYNLYTGALHQIKPGDSTGVESQNRLNYQFQRNTRGAIILPTANGFAFYNSEKDSLSPVFTPLSSEEERSTYSVDGYPEWQDNVYKIYPHREIENQYWVLKEIPFLFDVGKNEIVQTFDFPFNNDKSNRTILLDMHCFDDELLVTGSELGVTIYNFQSKTWQTYHSEEGNDEAFGQSIFEMHPLSDSLILYTGEIGAGIFNRNQRKFISFQQPEGMPPGWKPVYRYLAVDHAGVIWLGGWHGIFRSKRAVLPATKPPGIQYTIHALNDIKQNIFKRDTSGNGYEINHQGSIELSFVLTNSASLHEVDYKYRLKGFDQSWIDYKGGEIIRYTKLPIGEYEMEMIAVDENGLEHYKSISRIKVDGPFYKKLWFKALTILMLLVVLYTIFKLRLNARLREERINTQYQDKLNQLEMNALRAQMNPHFIFNSLNSIKRYLIKSGTDEAVDYLTKFSKLIRIFLENSKYSLLTLEQEVEALKLYVEMENKRL